MITLDEFYENFLQDILSDTESRGLLKAEAFFESVCEELVGTGELSVNYAMSNFIKKGMELNGFDYDEERQLLTLIVHNYFQENTIQTLTRQQMTTKFNRLKGYLTSASKGYYKEYEETAEGFDALYHIYMYLNKGLIKKIKFVIITDGKLTRSLESIDDDSFDGISIEHRVIDIEYIYKIYLSEFIDRTFEVDVKLPCLQVSNNFKEYDSYLVVMDGNTLAEIYDKYGQRLFEQNVRTFLQFKGSVNKGLRTTIEYNPKQFFAYNNGLTATASDVKIDDNGNLIKIIDFQIVNGAQTTSAIYAAKKNHKLNIDDIFVQMKLSVIKDNEEKNQAVSKISEYANTQNKVNKSDFFSNSPFHKEFKDYANRIWVAASGGSQRRTHWYYERVRGGYLNDQTYLSVSDKRKFLLEHPKDQLVDKTFLAKSENSWKQYPDVVSRGAQYSFSYFAEMTTDEIEKNSLAITEKYFMDAISRVILFRNVEKIVSGANWYNGGFRAQIVTYAISYLSYLVSKENNFFDFSEIWEIQGIPDDLNRCLELISEEISINISNPPEGFGNITQWCKQSKCWENVKRSKLSLTIPKRFMLDKEEMSYIKKENRDIKKLDRGIEMQMFVVKEVDAENWRQMHEYFNRPENLSEITGKHLGILKSMADGRLIPPSEKQSKFLYEIYIKAESMGVIIK